MMKRNWASWFQWIKNTVLRRMWTTVTASALDWLWGNGGEGGWRSTFSFGSHVVDDKESVVGRVHELKCQFSISGVSVETDVDDCYSISVRLVMRKWAEGGWGSTFSFGSHVVDDRESVVGRVHELSVNSL